MKVYFLLAGLILSYLSAPLTAKAAEQEWIVHLQNGADIQSIRSSAIQILKQEKQQMKIMATAEDIHALASVSAVQYIEPNKQKQASSLLSYNDPFTFQQWGLGDIQALPALEKYKQVSPNSLSGMTIGHKNRAETFRYKEQPLSPGEWIIHTNNKPLSRLSVTVSESEGPWSVKIWDEQGNLLGENESSLSIIDVLLPKTQMFHSLHVQIEGTETWSKTPSFQLYGTNAVRIAVIDSGISPHEDFCGNVLHSLGRDYAEALPYAEDRFGHGTFVTGVLAACGHNEKGITGILGNAPVDIIPLKVLDQSGNGDDFDISQAIYDAMEQEVDIINMSLAGKGETMMLRKAVMDAVNAGILLVAAAGNHETKTSGIYPASYPGVLTVTGTTKEQKPIPIANYGWDIDLSAPGANIISTYTHNRYETRRGTSLAAPYVSGAAALLKTEYPEMDAISLRHALVRSSKDIGEQGADPYTGYGLLQVEDARKLSANVTEAIEWLTIKSNQPLPKSSQLIGFSSGLFGQRAWLFADDQLQNSWLVTDSIMTTDFPLIQGQTVTVITTNSSQTITADGTVKVGEETTQTKFFQDVPSSFWAYEEIEQAAALGIVNGYGDGTFRPNSSISRRHAVIMLNRLFQWDAPYSLNAPFQDVPLEMPGFLSVFSAYEQGIIKGYGNQFQPDGTLTRAQIALMLARALQPTVSLSHHHFQDVSPSHHAYREIQQLVKLGIFSTGQSFRPNESVTRAQLCVMLVRVMNHLNKTTN